MRSTIAPLVARRVCGWAPVVGSDATARAVEVAKEVAERLRDREVLLAANRKARAQTRYPKTVYWEPSGVAQGDAGLALMCSYLDSCFPSENWDITGHEYLTLAVQGAEAKDRPPLGLFG